jgi:hypothetical protein
LKKYETVRTALDGSTVVRCTNLDQVNAHVAGLREALTEFELERWRYSKDIEATIAAIWAKVPPVA